MGHQGPCGERQKETGGGEVVTPFDHNYFQRIHVIIYFYGETTYFQARTFFGFIFCIYNVSPTITMPISYISNKITWF